MKSMISVSEARGLIDSRISALPLEEVALSAALGRVLAESVVSDVTVPPLDCSAMDGYAIRSEDAMGATSEAPVTLVVTGQVDAGSLATRPIEAGQAMRIMTGAPVPDGADSVIMIEKTRGERGAEQVEVLASTRPRQNIRDAGEDLQTGETVLEGGTLIGPPCIGLLASSGVDPVPVVRRPVVAVLPTGDELVEVDERPGPGGLRNSSGPALCAAVIEAGGVPRNLGIGRDDPAQLAVQVREGIMGADCLVTSAGVSVGDRDHVRQVLEAQGMETIFWRVRQKPGKPLLFGMIGDLPVFGLPGYPVSSMVTFEQYVRPAIRVMAGLLGHGRRLVRARLEETMNGAKGRLTWSRVSLRLLDDGQWSAGTAGSQGSGVLSTLSRADGLIEIPPDGSIEANEWAEVRLLREPR